MVEKQNFLMLWGVYNLENIEYSQQLIVETTVLTLIFLSSGAVKTPNVHFPFICPIIWTFAKSNWIQF